MSDFGLKERFVGSMKGVAFGVDKDIKLFDLTHQITPFNILEASETLAGTMPYWPEATVFVAVVDPGVGTARKSIVAKTRSGHFVVAPDNGTLTYVAAQQGIEAVREIDEALNRLPHSENSHTFHGRDVYVYTGARLASGIITFEETGPLLSGEIVQISYPEPASENKTVSGVITKVEWPYGNLTTNIPRSLLEEAGVNAEDTPEVKVSISHEGKVIFHQLLPYTFSFGYVKQGEALVYPDSVQHIGLALNGGSFAGKYDIDAGEQWKVTIVCT